MTRCRFGVTSASGSPDVPVWFHRGPRLRVYAPCSTQDESGRTVQRYVKDYRYYAGHGKEAPNCTIRQSARRIVRSRIIGMQAVIGLHASAKATRRRSSFYESQLPPDSLVTTTQIAKEYGCGAKVFNRLLHLYGIQYRANGQWVLYSEHHGKGYTSSLTFRLQRSDGSARWRSCTRHGRRKAGSSFTTNFEAAWSAAAG